MISVGRGACARRRIVMGGKNVDARQVDTVVKALGNGTNRRRVLQGLLVAGAGLGLGRCTALETKAAGATQSTTRSFTTAFAQRSPVLSSHPRHRALSPSSGNAGC